MRNFFLVLIVQIIFGDVMASNLDKSKEFFQKLSIQNINLVNEFYAPDVVFQDPVHRLTNSEAVTSYYKNLYSKVTSIRFEYRKGIEDGQQVSLEWRMFLKTPSIADGKEITVDGVSLIKFNAAGKAIEHRDYFDMGEFVYERVSILGSVIRYIKGRMSGESK